MLKVSFSSAETWPLDGLAWPTGCSGLLQLAALWLSRMSSDLLVAMAAFFEEEGGACWWIFCSLDSVANTPWLSVAAKYRTP